ncbi:MAG: hypothetical protein C4K58_05040 [Flavobacteriaceae bacterium]|nr:MAG: hypothetical protein C4K58_05040 [Flavobacteriaceae bacterium]
MQKILQKISSLYAVVDIESSGGKKGEEKIIEIAIYLFDGTSIVDQFISLVNPEKKIDPYVCKLTGISDKMVQTAPKFHQIAKRVYQLIQGHILVGHGVDFDYRMIHQEFGSLGLDLSLDTLDTLSYAQRVLLNEPSYSLGKLCKNLGIPLLERHRASGDAKATVQLLDLLLEKDSEKKYYNPTTSKDLERENFKGILEEIPSKMGIAYFMDEKTEILYIDFGGNLKNLCRKNLQSLSKNKQELQQKTKKIVCKTTENTAVNYLRAMEEIQKHRPMYNLTSKKGNHLFGLYLSEDKKSLQTQVVDKTALKQGISFEKKKNATDFLKKFIQFLEKKQAENPDQSLSLETEFLNICNYPLPNALLIGKGRNKEEKAFIEIQDNRLIGFGYFDLHSQILSAEKRKQRMILSQENATLKSEVLRYIFINQPKIQAL